MLFLRLRHLKLATHLNRNVNILFDFLGHCGCIYLKSDDEALESRDVYPSQEVVLTQNQLQDLTHIAYAVASGCDMTLN
jgi:hypothetical protein